MERQVSAFSSEGRRKGKSGGVEALRSDFLHSSLFLVFPFAKRFSGQKVFQDSRGGENIFEGALCQTLRRAAPGGSGAPQVVCAAPGPEMPWRGGGVGGAGGFGGLGLTVTGLHTGGVSAVAPSPAPFPLCSLPRGMEWSLRCPRTRWVGCSPRGTCSGNKTQTAAAARQLRQKGIAAPPRTTPLVPRSSPLRAARRPGSALRPPAAPSHRGAGEALRLFEMCSRIRGAAACNLRWRERFPVLRGVEMLPLPPSLAPSHRSSQAHLGANLAGFEVFIFLGVWHPWRGLTLRKERFNCYAFIILTRCFSIWIATFWINRRPRESTVRWSGSIQALYTWAQPWRCQINQGFCPLLAPFLTGIGRGQISSLLQLHRLQWSYTQGELTSQSFKHSVPRYNVETKFLQEAILSAKAR